MPTREFNQGLRIDNTNHADKRIVNVAFSAAYACAKPTHAWQVIVEDERGEQRFGQSGMSLTDATHNALDAFVDEQ